MNTALHHAMLNSITGDTIAAEFEAVLGLAAMFGALIVA